ncbi:unnamed protein product [Arabidopsis halleri]
MSRVVKFRCFFFPAMFLGSPTIMILKGRSLTSARIIDSQIVLSLLCL